MTTMAVAHDRNFVFGMIQLCVIILLCSGLRPRIFIYRAFTTLKKVCKCLHNLPVRTRDARWRIVGGRSVGCVR